ncbi:MAG: T9SS type A sorting domain-containing protein [Flavobacteriales bacterium]
MRNFKIPFYSLLATVVLHNGVQAQTGPGGVGSSSDNVVWYDVERMSSANGTSVSSLTDFSGNNNNVTQANSNERPTIVANSINGKDAIAFDGTDDQLSLGGISDLDNPNGFTFFAVLEGNDGNVFGLKYSNFAPAFSYRLSSALNIFVGYAPRSTNSTSSVTTALNTSWNIHSLTWVNSSNNVRGFMNGTNYHTKTNASGVPTTHTDFVIGKVTYSNVGFFDGSFGELIIFNTNLNTTQRTIIDNYLSAKYAIAVSTDKYIYEGSHPNEVAGIGQESLTDNHTTAQGTGIVQISGATDLENGEYAIWGHDGASTGSGSSEIPTSFTASGLKLNREWRIDMSGGDGSVGNVDVRFTMTGINFGADKTKYVIISDADGDFSDGNATVHAIAPGVNGDLITFSSVPLADGDFFTIANTNDLDECASFNTNSWGSATWIPCFVTPDSLTNATISDGTTITVTTTQSVNDLTIEEDLGSGGGNLVINANQTLIITGNLTIGNSGSLTMNSGSTIIFRGTTAQSLTNNSGSTVTLFNLAVNNTNGLTLDGSDFLELSNGLTLTNGDLTVNDTLTFLSDATRTAHVNAVPNGSIIGGSGAVIIQRFRSGRASYWGDIASSGVDCAIEELDDDIFISGIPGGDGYAGSSNGGSFISIYYWDETIDDYASPASTNDNFELGRGYEVWLADNNTTWDAKAWDLTGAINLDPVSISVSSSGSNWNLIGNPYPGYLDWDNIIANHPGIDNGEFYFMDATGGAYTLASGAGLVIAPGEAMWIQTTGLTTIDLDPANDLLSNQSTSSYRKRSAADALEIQLRNTEAPFGSNAYIIKDDMSFVGKDDRDVSPLRIPDPRSCLVSIVSGADESMVNYVPTTESSIELPVKVESGVAGKFTLNFNGLESFNKYQCVQLIDQRTGEQYPISDNYTLDIDLNEGSLSKDYTLILQEEDGIDCVNPQNAESNSPFKIWSNGDDITIDFYLSQSTLSSITIYDALGDIVSSQSKNVSYTRTSISGSTLSRGIYFVNVSANGYSETQRIILN